MENWIINLSVGIILTLFGVWLRFTVSQFKENMEIQLRNLAGQINALEIRFTKQNDEVKAKVGEVEKKQDSAHVMLQELNTKAALLVMRQDHLAEQVNGAKPPVNQNFGKVIKR